jgi:hypothetical protein
MRLLLVVLLAFGFSFTSLAAGLQIYNGTDHTVYVKVGLNDGTDCVPDSWITVCIPAMSTSTHTITDVPFSVRVWTPAAGCTPDYSAESWQHNLVWSSCADAPTSDTNPYSMTWYHPWPTSWGINIEVT